MALVGLKLLKSLPEIDLFVTIAALLYSASRIEHLESP